ncbi:hypothetical protein BP5796_01099 [Coleophoma crateriformis]|uniref:Myb-like DNA-binding domain-containing protein n=1 Tax=Coleophoma crateriformis TaxID=565419 RepID=A0A3D8T9W6_9HELO|nr:hypothetical protein BP5796_01099 [Coleophoma crateriformis]
MPSPSGEPAGPTTKEALFFLSILANQKTKPDVDWDLVAQKNGYNNGNTAKTRFGQIKRRLGYTDDYVAPKAGGSGGRKPKAKAEAEGSSSGSGMNKTPTKVKKTPAKPKNGKASKASFANAALAFSQQQDEFAAKFPGNHDLASVKDEEASPGYDDDDSGSRNFDDAQNYAYAEHYADDEDKFYDPDDMEQV